MAMERTNDTPIGTATDMALGIPEIRSHIGEFLDWRDIATCRLVSQEWNASFNPYLWRTLRIRTSIPPFLAHNVHHVQKLRLSIRSKSLDNILHGFHQLRELSLSFRWKSDKRHPNQESGEESSEESRAQGLYKVEAFLRAECSKVQELSIFHQSDYCIKEICVAALIGCGQRGQLRKLSYVMQDLSYRSFLMIWRFICCLEVPQIDLTLGCISVFLFESLCICLRMHEQRGAFENSRFYVSQVRHFDLHIHKYGGSGKCVVALLKLCPHLEVFNFDSMDDFRPFQQMVGRGELNGLHSLKGDFKGLLDEEAAFMIKGMTRVEALDLEGSDFGLAALTALRDHPQGLRNLKKLDMYWCEAFSSPMIQTILEEARQLKVFRTDALLRVRDVLSGRPWSCASSLTELVLNLVISDGDMDAETDKDELVRQNKRMLGMILQLSNLQDFCTVGGNGMDVGNGRRPIAFDMKNGLDLLLPLVRLETMEFDEGSQPLGLDEVDWIVGHWPRLKCLTVRIAQELLLPPELETRIKLRGLKVSWHRV